MDPILPASAQLNYPPQAPQPLPPAPSPKKFGKLIAVLVISNFVLIVILVISWQLIFKEILQKKPVVTTNDNQPANTGNVNQNNNILPPPSQPASGSAAIEDLPDFIPNPDLQASWKTYTSTQIKPTESNVKLEDGKTFKLGDKFSLMEAKTGSANPSELCLPWSITDKTGKTTLPRTVGNTTLSYTLAITIDSEKFTGDLLSVQNPFPKCNFTPDTFALPMTYGLHQIELEIDPDKKLAEQSHENNILIFSYEVTAEQVPPEIQVDSFRNNDTKETCVEFSAVDNISTETEMEYHTKLDSEPWQEINYRPDPASDETYHRCLTGPPGQTHTFSVRVFDKRGNLAEQSLRFPLLQF
jgi:hypothetical protein